MKITIRVDKNYGILTYYPVCDRSKIFARLAGTKTLTGHALADIDALGYEIEIKSDAPRTFARLEATQ